MKAIGIVLAVVASVVITAMGKVLVSDWLRNRELNHAMSDATRAMQHVLPVMIDEETRWESLDWSMEDQALVIRHSLVGTSTQDVDGDDFFGQLPLTEMACMALMEIGRVLSTTDLSLTCPRCSRNRRISEALGTKWARTSYETFYFAYPTIRYVYEGDSGSVVGTASVDSHYCAIRDAEIATKVMDSTPT